jgi:hypothetical protein
MIMQRQRNTRYLMYDEFWHGTGHAQALVAIEHNILMSIFYMLQRDQSYHDLGADYFIRREDPTRRARKLIHQLEAIGYTLQAQPPPPAAA